MGGLQLKDRRAFRAVEDFTHPLRTAGGSKGGECGRDRRKERERQIRRASVGEDLILLGEEGAAGVDHGDAGQPILSRDLLGPKVLLDRDGVVRALVRKVGRGEEGRKRGRSVANHFMFFSFSSLIVSSLCFLLCACPTASLSVSRHPPP